MPARVLVLCVLMAGPTFAQQEVPSLRFESVPDFLKPPAGMNFGEVPGVAVDSRGHVFVFTRSNSALARRIRSRWPSVGGSNVPAKRAVVEAVIWAGILCRYGNGL